MKKFKKMLTAALLLVLCGLLTVGFTACVSKETPTTGTQPPHTHSYTVWQYDETGHWLKCAEDDAIGEVSNHNFVDGTCECGYKQPAPPVKYGSAEAIIHLLKGEEPISDYSDVTVSLDDNGPVVTLDPATGKLTITNLVAGKDYRLTVAKPDYITVEMTICADEDELVKIGGDAGIVVRYNKVSMTYTVANGAGYEINLLDANKNVLQTKTVEADNTVTFDELSTESKYYLSIRVFNLPVTEQIAEVNGDGVANVNFGVGFAKDTLPPKTIEYASENNFAPYVFQNLNLEGDFFFAAKFRVTELTTGLEKEVRFGFRMKYGDQEYDHTFLIEGGKWRMQQMNSWWGEDLTAAQTDALMGDGLIVAISRVAETGEVILYYGTSIDNMVREPRAAWTANTDKQKNPITEFGIRLWGEAGKGEYKAVVTPFGYGTTLAEALGVERTVTVSNDPVENGRVVVSGSKVYDDFVLDIQPDVDCTLKSLTINGQDALSLIVDGKIILKAYNQETLTIVAEFERTIYGQIDANAVVNKHGTPSYALADGTQVTLSNAFGSYSATVAGGKISVRVPVGTYTVSAEGYNSGCVIVTESGVTDDIAVEYILFSSLKGWDTDLFDASNVNAVHAIIAQNGKTLNILTCDSYGNVVATLHVKAGNTTHVNRTQGIIIQFADGKNMIIDIVAPNREEARIMWEKNGIWSLPVPACENKYGTGWELGAGEQHYNRPFPQATWDAFNGDGFDLTVVREGIMLYVYVDGNYAGKFEVPEEYATQQAKVGFFSYDCVADASWAFSISEDISAYAQDVTVEKDQPENGTITLDKDSYVLGDMVTVTLTANTGYKVATLKLDGVDVTSAITGGTYTFKAMKNAYRVEATFEEKTDAEYSVAVSGHKYGTSGNTIADGTVITLDGGALGTFTATVTDGRIAGTLPIGTYTVKLDGYVGQQVQVTLDGIADAITLEYDLMYNVASTWNWGDQIDFAGQNNGTVIKAAQAGVLWAATNAKYGNVAITTTFVKDGGGRQGAFVKFGNAYVLVQLEAGSGDNAGKYKITWNAQNPCSGCGTSVLTGWSELVGYGFSNWTDELTQKLEAGTLQVTLVRKDDNVLAFMEGKLVGQAHLKDAQIGQLCEVGVYIQSAPTDRAIERNFVIEEDISKYTYTEQFGLQNTADQSQVSEGILKATGNMEVATLETYGDMTAEFNWKYPGSGNRYGFALVMGDGNVLRFDVRYNDGGKYDIQRCGWGNIPNYGWQDNAATYDQAKYETDGIYFKVVRQGASVKIYVNGELAINYENIGDSYADDHIRLRFNTEGASEIHYSISASVEA